MQENIYFTFLVISQLFIVSFADSSTFIAPPFMRHGTCRAHKATDDAAVKDYGPYIALELNRDKPKGYLGTVGILGGSVGAAGPAYFAAMAALRVGADAVHIICTNAVGSALQSLGPDIAVHPLVDVNHEKLYKVIEAMDVVVIGPGMDKEYGSSPALIHQVIERCKKTKKPIVLDLDPIFLTAATLNILQTYPLPGYIMLMNDNEFEVFYKLIKTPKPFSDTHIDVDMKKLGNNFLIYRKGCTDTAFSNNLKSSWSYSAISSPRRTMGQGNIITGATAVYFNWAINTMAENSTRLKAPMLPAAVATHRAAKLMRLINDRVFKEKNRAAITSDMILEISDVLYGTSSVIDEE